MKKLIALLIVALMAVTGVLACAESALTPPMTIVNTVTLDRDTCRKTMTDMGLNARQIELVEGVLDLVEASSQRLVVVEDGFEYNMILDGNTVAILAGDISPEGVSIGSNMFPHCLLTVSNATINDLLARFDGEPQTADETEVKTESKTEGNTKGERPTLLSKLMALIRENSEKLVDLVSSSIDIGQSQAGEYVVDGDTYNAMIPVSVDTRAIADGIVDMTDKFIHSEPVARLQAVLRRVDIDIPLETPVIGDVPTVTATVYACQDEAGNANGPLYVNAGIAGANATPLIQGQVRVDGENARVKFEIPAFELEVKYEQFQSDNGGFARADINAGEIYFGLALEATLGDVSHLSFNVYSPDPSKPLVSDDIAISKGGQKSYVIEGKNTTVLSVEGLMSGEEENGSWLSVLADMAVYSAIEIMGNAYNAQPEVENLINLLLGE